MVRGIATRLAIGAAVLVSGQALSEDGVCLHQQVLRLHSSIKEAAKPVPEPPSKTEVTKIRPMMRQAVDNMMSRATTAAKVPIPKVFLWDLVGRLTQSAMKSYQKPKSPGNLQLVDELLEHYLPLLGAKDFPTISDQELQTRFLDMGAIHDIAQHYADKVGAPPAVRKVIDKVAEVQKSKGTLDANTSQQMLIDVVSQTGGPAAAELVSYLQQLSAGQVKLDPAHLMDLEVPILVKIGAPAAAIKYVKESAGMAREGKTPAQSQEGARLAKMLSSSAEELGMPPAIAEYLRFMQETLADADNTKISTSPELQKASMAKAMHHFGKINEQLDGLKSISALLELLGKTVESGATADPQQIADLLAKASGEAGFPSALTEFMQYMGPLVAQNKTADTDKALDLMIKLNSELGLPEAATKVIKDARAKAAKKGSALDTQEMTKITAQLLRKLGMPAFAEIYNHLAVPMITKGKQPDAMAMAMVAPSLMKILPDFETADNLAKTVQAKVIAPLTTMHDKTMAKLTGKMPESGFSTVVKGLLNMARPKVAQ